MKKSLCKRIGAALLVPILLIVVGAAVTVRGAVEERFDVLQVGTHVYRNVTVTTKGKSYIFILHSGGMTSIKVADLPPEALKLLGYADPNQPKIPAKTTTIWPSKALSKLDVTSFKFTKDQLTQNLADSLPATLLSSVTTDLLWMIGGIFLVCYLLFCYCCARICQKVGMDPGIWVWLPVIQVFPLLKAAEMSPWWFLGFLVPGVNLVGQLIWCFKISIARRKPAWLGLFLFLPVTSLLVFLYLAFSGGAVRPADERQRRVEIMTLETA